MQGTEQKLFDLDAASKSLGNISEWTLRRHCRQGTVKTVRIGKRIFLSAAEISRISEKGLPSLKAQEPIRAK
jgi:hypothetical protein